MNTFLERCRIQYAQAGNLKRRTKARRAADGDTACKQTGSEQNADPGSDPKAGIGRTCAHDTEKRRGGSGDYRKNLRDVLEVRCALEELAVQLACDRINQEEIHELHAAAARFEQMFDSDDITSIAQADEAFHDVIFQATDNERLIQLLNNLREQMYRYRIEYLKKKECYPQLIAEHEAIMQAIEGHDKAMATQITGQHINNQVDTVVGTLRSKMPDF